MKETREGDGPSNKTFNFDAYGAQFNSIKTIVPNGLRKTENIAEIEEKTYVAQNNGCIGVIE